MPSHLRRVLGLLLIASLALVAPAGADASAAVGTRVGGIIATDTTWTAAGGPYVFDSVVQIAAGATLRIEPGTVIDGNNVGPFSGSIFQVAGSLKIEGSATQPVVLEGHGSSGVAGPVNNATAALLSVEHARITGFDAIFPPSGGGGHANYLLADSVVTGTTYMSYFWYPTSYARVERNLFVNAAALTFGTSQDQTATVVNNRFRGTSNSYSYKHWIESWAAYGSPLQVHGNSFEKTGSPAPAMTVASDGKIDASGNDWGTTDVAAVKARIRDKDDDLNLPSVVTVEPLLDAPAAATPAAPPFATNAPATVPGDRQVALSWSAPAEIGGAPITSFEVKVEPIGRVVTVPGDTYSAVVDALSNGTAYTFTVTAVSAAGPSPASAPSVPTTPAGAPNAPQQVLAVPGDGFVRVSWAAAEANGSPVSSYTVTTLPGGRETTTTATSVNIEGLSDGQEYRFTVSAANAVGSSPQTEPSAPVTAAHAPSAPADVTAARRDRSVQLSWQPSTAHGSPALGYLVTVQPGGRQIQVAGAGTTSYLVTSLSNGVAYTFTVAAASRVANSTAVATAAVTPAGAPLQMTRPTLSRSGRNVTVRWKPATANGAAVTSYVITRSNGRPVTVRATATSTTLKALRPGRYSFTVSARNAVGLSRPSAATTVKVPGS